MLPKIQGSCIFDTYNLIKIADFASLKQKTFPKNAPWKFLLKVLYFYIVRSATFQVHTYLKKKVLSVDRF